MASKLVLELEEPLIRKAEAWAANQGLSVSQAISRLVAGLPEPDPEPELSPWVRSFAGCAASADGSTLTDEEVREAYTDYLIEKYK